MSATLLGKLALITGAGSGLGRATCQVLAREGARIVAVDMNTDSTNETIDLISKHQQNQDHMSFKADVTDKSSIQNCLKEVLNRFQKPPTIVVNCAGITRDNFILKISEEDFDEVIKVNLKGTFLVTQTFAKALVERDIKDASIITLASISAYGNIGQCNYSASKAGVQAFTISASKEFAKYGIRCNTVLPGFIATPMTDAIPEKVKAKLLPLIPLQRMGRPEEVAELISFLASDKSSYITGASIDIAGGFTL